MSTVIDGTWDDLAADYLGYLAHGRATIRTVATPGDSRYAWLDPHRGWRLVDKSSLHQSIAAWRDTLVASPPEPTGDDKTDEKARRYWVDVCRRLSDAAGKNHLLEALAAVQRPVDVEDADRPGRIGFSNGVLDVRRWLAGDPTAFEPWSHLSPFLLRNTGYPWQPADEETLDDLRTGWLDTSIVDENGAPDRDTQTMLLSQIARAMLGERQPAALVWLLGHDDPGITELLPTGTIRSPLAAAGRRGWGGRGGAPRARSDTSRVAGSVSGAGPDARRGQPGCCRRGPASGSPGALAVNFGDRPCPDPVVLRDGRRRVRRNDGADPRMAGPGRVRRCSHLGVGGVAARPPPPPVDSVGDRRMCCVRLSRGRRERPARARRFREGVGGRDPCRVVRRDSFGGTASLVVVENILTILTCCLIVGYTLFV